LNELYYLSDSNMLVGLEKGEVAMKSKTKLGGIGGSSTEYVMNGAASPFRTGNSSPSFVIKMGNTMMGDPSTAMRLYKFDKKDKERTASISKAGFMGKGSSTNTEGISFHMKQSDGAYILIPDKPLEPGEYGFINLLMPVSSGGGRTPTMAYKTFAFGVDRQ